MSLEAVAAMISRGEYKDVLRHPARDNQWIFILDIDEYTWALPFVLDDEESGIFLKTAFRAAGS